MSAEDEKVYIAARDLGPKEISKWIRTKGGALTCEVCGSTSWNNLIDRENQRVAVIAFRSAEEDVEDAYTSVIVLRCENCCNMKFFDRYHIAERIEQEKSIDQGDDNA